MVYETDPSLEPVLQKYSCAFLSLAHYNPSFSDQEINSIYDQGIVSEIFDKECTILDWQRLADLLRLPLKYREGHWPVDTDLSNGEWFIGEWCNQLTMHFVAMDNAGNVIYDPIEGGSKTVANGHLVSYRIFDKA